MARRRQLRVRQREVWRQHQATGDRCCRTQSASCSRIGESWISPGSLLPFEGRFLLGYKGLYGVSVVRGGAGPGHHLALEAERVRQGVGCRVCHRFLDRGIRQRRPGGEVGGERSHGRRPARRRRRPSRPGRVSSASSALIVRGIKSSSIALVGPISRGSVHEEPVSHDSATPVKAVLKPACIRGHAQVAGERDRHARRQPRRR